VLEPRHGLDDATLAAIGDLERRTVAADGGRLKLEWGVLRSRPADQVEDLLWWDGGRLVGFLGIYAFGAPTAELTGMVDPNFRRRGIATALLEAALPLCRERRYSRVLLVTPRTPPAAAALAQARGGVLDHSEHALQLDGDPADGPTDPRVTLRGMDAGDRAAVDALLRAGFGWERPQDEVADDAEVEHARSDEASTLVVELGGEVIGTLRRSRDQDAVGVYGFVIRPDHQGRGIGGDVLRRVCRQARADGATRVHLEVVVGNDRALGLYTAIGFERVATEDYYALPM